LVREYRQYIGGEWIGSEQLFDDFDPYRGTVMARVPAGTRADAARAVDAAAAAFPAWAELPPAEKQALFLRAADVVERRRGDIVALLAEETGCAGGFAGFQVLTATRLLRQAANWGYLPVGEVIRSDAPGTFAMALRRPLGVVAGISPWNGAHVLAWRTVVNPLAFGNTVVLKPSEEAPISAGLLIGEIMEEAGFPAGVINVVTHAPGAAVPIADEFFDRPEVRCINFTGSSAVGRILAERAGRALKRRLRRVLPLRADLHVGQEGAGRAAGLRHLHGQAGQADGDPAGGRPGRRRHRDRADVPSGARIHAEETFGPVLVAQPVEDADEAVAVANSTAYGLSAGLITGDNQRGFTLAQRIDSGVVHVNDQTVADEPQLPLGA
jgi:acyl-CoA reductase-like NAD-dependent aldehyde dehydrogenase